MDQQLQSLDPKLREAYERIMGTNSKSTVQTAVNTDTQATPVNPVSIQPTPSVTAPIVKPEENKQNETPQQTFGVNSQVNNNYVKPEMPHSEPAIQTPSPFSAPPLSAQKFNNSTADNQMHAYVSQEVAGVKQSLKTIQLIYIVGGIVFFVVYALFWLKFFNIASPI